MNIYDLLISPLEMSLLSKIRKELISCARGDILEIGVGTGVNFKYYSYNSINTLTAINMDFNKQAQKRAPSFVTFLNSPAEKLPFKSQSFDTVIETLVLCSVKDISKVIAEIERVLKPGGFFIFLDHALPTSPRIATIFKGLNLFWPHISGGCNLNREIFKLEFRTLKKQ